MNDHERAKKLTRFGADPEKVRVSLRRYQAGQNVWWIAKVASRIKTTQQVTVSTGDPSKALCAALEGSLHIAGVDPSLSWSYDHPWGAEGAAKNDYSPCPYYENCPECGELWDDHGGEEENECPIDH